MARRSPYVVAAAVVIALMSATACSDDEAPVGLSSAGLEGRDIANSSGCAACHGSDGEGGVGPAFVGLVGSDVELEDGSTVVADEDYLFRSIDDPGSQKVEGFAASMPENSLTDAQIQKVIAYIDDLG